MNILRWKRKSKKKLKLRTFLLVIFSLVMTTFAWFAYSKILNTSLNMHVASWDMEYYIGTDKKTNPIGIEIPTLSPAMPEQAVTIDIKNNGETLVDIEYEVKSVTIAGVSYNLVQEDETNFPENYIIITPSVRNGEIVKGAITNDIKKFPFTIEIEHSAQISPKSEGYLTVKANWIGDNNEFDTEWGYKVGEYLLNNPTVTSVMSISLSIESYQVDPNGETIVETLPSTAETSPYLPTGFARVAGTNLNNGFVTEDSLGNQYVWIEVPRKSSVYTTAGLGITSFTDTDYTNIEIDLKNYSATYRTRNDQFTTYQATGLSEGNYLTLKQKMLKSIYQNGGFYIGRYETGIEDSYRTSYSTSIPTEIPVIKSNAYPFNYVTCSQAQNIASSMSSGEYTSSLMFGLQWNLVLKYLETKGTNTTLLKNDSSTWGNYSNSIYEITNPKAKFLLSSDSSWSVSPHSKQTTESMLLTTAGNSMFINQNIYDLSGNLAEWTFNLAFSDGKVIGGNGGDYTVIGTVPATNCASYDATYGFKNVGFRITIF